MKKNTLKTIKWVIAKYKNKDIVLFHNYIYAKKTQNDQKPSKVM